MRTLHLSILSPTRLFRKPPWVGRAEGRESTPSVASVVGCRESVLPAGIELGWGKPSRILTQRANHSDNLAGSDRGAAQGVLHELAESIQIVQQSGAHFSLLR